jgi:hypothetical protein
MRMLAALVAVRERALMVEARVMERLRALMLRAPAAERKVQAAEQMRLPAPTEAEKQAGAEGVQNQA